MTKQVELFGAFDRALKHAPDGGWKEHFDHFLETVNSNPAYTEALALEYFNRMYAQKKLKNERGSVSLVPTPAAERRKEAAARRAEIEESANMRATRVVNQIKKVILLDQVLSNGKKARECTFADAVRESGYWGAVGRKGKPAHMITKELKEADLQNIWSRYWEDKRRPAGQQELRA